MLRWSADIKAESCRQGRSQDFISTEAKGWTGGLGVEPPVGSRSRAPGQGWSPSEAESFSVVRYPKEMENLLQCIIFLFYGLFIIQQNVWSCIYYTTMPWWRVIITRLEMLWLSDNRINYSKENLKIHTAGPPHSLPLFSLVLSPPLPAPVLPSHSCISPFT